MISKILFFILIISNVFAAKNVILMIPDGFGPVPHTLAEYVANTKLHLNDYLQGTVWTHSSSSIVTDSAASATAYSCGKKTYNTAVAVDDNKKPLLTVLERARDLGYATGIVVTCQVWHATPAAFTAHVETRYMTEEIALQQSRANVTVMFGGGRKEFYDRKDKRNLLEEMKQMGYTIVTKKEELYKDIKTPVFGAFADGELDFDIEKNEDHPHLTNMTIRALQLLEKAGGDKGFFLLVEGSKIDWALHENDARTAVDETLGFDQTFKIVVEYAKRKGNTLVISVADHDTGGLAIGDNNYTFLPSVLRRQTTSTRRMAQEMRNRSIKDVLKSLAGIDDLTAEEERSIQDASGDSAKARAIAKVISTRSKATFAHNSHTAAKVNIYAYGPPKSYDILKGSVDNTVVTKAISDFLGLNMPKYPSSSSFTFKKSPIKIEKTDIYGHQ